MDESDHWTAKGHVVSGIRSVPYCPSQSIQVFFGNLNKHRNGSSHTVQQAYFGPEARAAGNISRLFPKVSNSQFPKSRVFIIIFAEVWRTQDEDSTQDHLIDTTASFARLHGVQNVAIHLSRERAFLRSWALPNVPSDQPG